MANLTKSPFMLAQGANGNNYILDERFVPNNVFFVGSAVSGAADSAGRGQTPDQPLLTIDYAIGLCTASKGDLIIVLPGHVETISTAGGLTCDVAGITIHGLGNGANRPKLLFTAAGSTCAISAANVTLRNMYCSPGVDEVVKMFNITAAYCTLDAIDHVEDANFQTIQFLLTSAAGDFLTMQNCRHYQDTVSASAQLWIEIVGGDGAVIRNNIFMLKLSNNATSTTLNVTGTAANLITIDSNIICQIGGTTQDNFISLVASTTGLVSNNRIGGDVGTLAASVDLASAYGSENYIATTANKSGILDPVVA